MENEENEDKEVTSKESLWFDYIWGMEYCLREEILPKYKINEKVIPNKIDDEDKPEFKRALVKSLRARLDWLRKRADVAGVYMFMSTTAE